MAARPGTANSIRRRMQRLCWCAVQDRVRQAIRRGACSRFSSTLWPARSRSLSKYIAAAIRRARQSCAREPI